MAVVRAKLLRLALVGLSTGGVGFSQIALSLSSGSGTLGGSVTLNLSLAATGTPPADLQWTLNYSTTDFSAVSVAAGGAASAASKSVTCNSVAGNLTCLVYGINSSTIANGVVAAITLTISASTPDTSSLVQVTGTGSASEPGINMSASTTSSTVTIGQPATYTISGTISGAGGNGATVKLSGAASATTTANSSGAYSFSGLANGSYTVTPTRSGYTFSPASAAVTVSGANQTANFTSTSTGAYTISGTISGAGGNGATVTLSGAASATTAANSSGAYSFSGLANGSYTVTPTRSGYTFSPASAAVTVSGANQTANFTSTSTGAYTISGTISGAGGNGATVKLSGAASATTAANSSGAYSFSGLANGGYTVTPTRSGYTFSPASAAVTVSGANQTANFTSTSTGAYTISGTISGAGGNGATVKLSRGASATTTANSSGAYSFSGLANGGYTVVPIRSGYTFSPAIASVTVSGANQTVNFTSTACQGTCRSPGSAVSETGGSATAAPNGTDLTTDTIRERKNFSGRSLDNIGVTGITCNPAEVIPPAGSTCQVSISAASPSGGTTVGLSSDAFSVIEPLSLNIPAGATISSFNVTGMQVTGDTTVHVTASLAAGSASFPLVLRSRPSSTGLRVDVTISQDSPPEGSISSPPFSTASSNELLLALISASGTTPGTTVTSVAGAGLNWELVLRENAQHGTSEIWRAFAPSPLSGVSVTAALSNNVDSAMTVMSFVGVDPSGANGSAAIGATAVANAVSGVPSVSLVTTRGGSIVVGVGNDNLTAAKRTPGTGQSVVSQYSRSNEGTRWVQAQIDPSPLSGTTLTINDAAPSATYNLAAVEIRPPAACALSLVPQSRAFGVSGASSSTIVAGDMGCDWKVSTDSPSWIALGAGAGTGNGSFTFAVSPSLGPTRMGTISVGDRRFTVLEDGTSSVFSDVTQATPNSNYINLMYHLGISGGCSSSPLRYCPSTSMTRGQMAALVVSALDGNNYVQGGLPRSYTLTPYFQDVPATDPYFPFVQRLADLNLVDACQTSPSMFCPSQPETQGQIAKLMIQGWMYANKLSSFTYSPLPYFNDVSASDPDYPYIQKIRDLGFWFGCKATQYCPDNSVLESDIAALVMRSLLGAP